MNNILTHSHTQQTEVTVYITSVVTVQPWRFCFSFVLKNHGFIPVQFLRVCPNIRRRTQDEGKITITAVTINQKVITDYSCDAQHAAIP